MRSCVISIKGILKVQVHPKTWSFFLICKYNYLILNSSIICVALRCVALVLFNLFYLTVFTLFVVVQYFPAWFRSGSVIGNRLLIIKSAVIQLLDTLQENDFVNIIYVSKRALGRSIFTCEGNSHTLFASNPLKQFRDIFGEGCYGSVSLLALPFILSPPSSFPHFLRPHPPPSSSRSQYLHVVNNIWTYVNNIFCCLVQ